MSDESDDIEVGDNSLDELKVLLDELSDEISAGNRKQLFKMAEFLLALDVKSEICQVRTSKDTYEYGIVIPIKQINKLRKALVGKAI